MAKTRTDLLENWRFFLRFAEMLFRIVGLILIIFSGTLLSVSAGSKPSLFPSRPKVSPSTGSANSGVRLSRHDIALRFLTAFIRLDRNMALQYATPQAVAKLDWNVPHRGNIPYYDDKMLLQFRGGWAKVLFQEVDGSYLIVDFDVHRR